jgi:hypothetical protein
MSFFLSLSLSLSLSLRPDPGSEDRDGQEGRAAVVHAYVHGLQALFHLQDEVCWDKRWAMLWWVYFSDPIQGLG